MKIVNVRGHTLDIRATGQRVVPGETVEVPDEIGGALLEQPANWAKPKAKTKKEPAASGDDQPEEGNES